MLFRITMSHKLGDNGDATGFKESICTRIPLLLLQSKDLLLIAGNKLIESKISFLRLIYLDDKVVGK